MYECPHSLIKIPLGMTNDPGPVIQYGKQHGFLPFALTVRYLPGPMMEIQMPQTMHVIHFKTAHLAIFQSLSCRLCALCITLAYRFALAEAIHLHVTADRAVGRHWPQFR